MKAESTLPKEPKLIMLGPFLCMLTLMSVFLFLGLRMVREGGVGVVLPTSNSVMESTVQSQVVTISAGPEARLFLNYQPITMAEFEKELPPASRDRRRLIIRADQASTYGRVMQVSEIALGRGYEVVYATSTLSRAAKPAQ
jgi:biopolymer transport protein ExbD